jgi:hypothetical protein
LSVGKRLDRHLTGGLVRKPRIDDRVRLTHDIPELGIRVGESGVVCSAWTEPTLAFEVEFGGTETHGVVRALVADERLEVEDASLVKNLPFTIPAATS